MMDLVIYAHDGRGLGHISRSVGIGLAYNRLYPHSAVCLVSGAPHVHELLAGRDLEWIKLPSYSSPFRARHRKAPMQLGQCSLERVISLRRDLLKRVLSDLSPKCVLVDHIPAGRHDELRPAQAVLGAHCVSWVLGVREVVGAGTEFAHAVLAGDLSPYQRVLRYGVGGEAGDCEIWENVAVPITTTGYVSRALEVERLGVLLGHASRYDIVFSMPWASEKHQGLEVSARYCSRQLAESGYRSVAYSWNPTGKAPTLTERHVCGADYLSSLKHARVLVGYAGYNTITDILWAGTPGVLVMREFPDREQARHAARISRLAKGVIDFIPESTMSPERILAAIRSALTKRRMSHELPMEGAAVAAMTLRGLVLANA